jgi:cytochrome oxidase Cu insertion factor (SCO1/SenC/PrrC family)
MLGVGTMTPLYTGPAEIGRRIPKFTTTLADGTPFTEKDLERGNPTVVLFFRGRW